MPYTFTCAIRRERVTKSQCVVCFNANENGEQYIPYCRQVYLELPQIRGKRDR